MIFTVQGRWLRRCADYWLDLWFPAACLLCDRRLIVRTGAYFCSSCLEQKLQSKEDCCRRCGMILPARTVPPGSGCGWCRHRVVPLDGCVAAVPYETPIRELLLQFKTTRGAWLASPLARLLLECRGTVLRDWDVDLVLGVPRHIWRRLTTGHDQARTLAWETAKGLGIERMYARYPLARVRLTSVHSGLSPAERARNVRGAFRVTRSHLIAGRRILVVDDVMTSGATLFEIGRILRKAGAVAVFAATVARAGTGR